MLPEYKQSHFSPVLSVSWTSRTVESRAEPQRAGADLVTRKLFQIHPGLHTGTGRAGEEEGAANHLYEIC